MVPQAMLLSMKSALQVPPRTWPHRDCLGFAGHACAHLAFVHALCMCTPAF